MIHFIRKLYRRLFPTVPPCVGITCGRASLKIQHGKITGIICPDLCQGHCHRSIGE